MKAMLRIKPSAAKSGNVLLVTVMTLLIVSGFVGLSVEYTNNVGRNVQRSLLLRQATNIADASTEMAFSSWRSIARAKGSSPPKTSDLDNEIPTPTPGNFPGVSNYTLSNYRVFPLDSRWVAMTGSAATPAPVAGQTTNDVSNYYVASADVVIPTVTSKNPTSLTDPGNVVAQVRRVFQKEVNSLWRYAIFFDDDLEMHPGPLQTVTGDVHTNGSLYTGHDTLTLNGRTTYTRDWSIGFKPGDNQHPETPTSPNWPVNLPPANEQSQPPYGQPMADYHQIIESSLVSTGLDPALNAYRFENQAGVKVTVDASNNVKIYNASGVDITNLSGTNTADKRLANAFRSAMSTNQVITDKREGATTGNGNVRLASLDVGVIAAAIASTSSSVNISFNRVIYLIDTSADPNGINAKRGFRLKNGATLPDGGLTIVSANPVYVQGDYNTGSTTSVQPASNTQAVPAPGATPPSPTVPGYSRKPAAIVADAVNVLSNSWVDSASASTPVAAPTTVNAGIISGNVASANGYYSGGVENFPRFHENWSNKPFTYYGSMLQLYQSKQAIGRWGPGYNAPQRAWYFDTNFMTNPPPGLLNVINYRRSRWYML